MAERNVLSSVINTIDTNTRKPEQFLSVQNQAAVNFRNSVKRLYDFTKEQSHRSTNALPELVTEGFDEEQIWQQLELQNEGELEHLLTGISKVLAGNKKLTVPISLTKPESPSADEQDSSDKDDESAEDSEDEPVDDYLNLERAGGNARGRAKRKKKSSIVDDKFFKLQELDEYLTKEETKETQARTSKDARESDEESVDLFNDASETEEVEDGEGKLLKYADFFDSPRSEDEAEEDQDETSRERNKGTEDEDSLGESDAESGADAGDGEEHRSTRKVSFNLTNDSDETDSLENKASNVKEDAQSKSSLETRQERLRKKIDELEGAALAEKPWQLKGEVAAGSRPQNSLLEEFVEFDVTTRPAPVITEETTLKLEDIIKQRVKDKAWDDVEKKFKPVETPMEYKKKLILNQEKSKESLSQIYENEYLRQKQALNPEHNEQEEEEPKLHTEIREMMHSLFSKLDALSNFHYTPKLAKPEIKVISNVPAISMEEVAPVATSDGTLLAPEEIKAKSRGDPIGKAERTQTDMKRERRRKKLRQRARQQALEKKEKLGALKPGFEKKYKKDNAAAALMKKLTKDRNISKLDETSQKVTKSSTAFFNQLQDQVKSHIKAKASPASQKKQKKAVTAVKLKL